MTIYFYDGFDHYSTDYIPAKWTETEIYGGAGGSVTIDQTGGRRGTGALKLICTTYSWSYCHKELDSNITDFVIGFAVKGLNAPGDFLNLILWDGTTKQCYIYITSSDATEKTIAVHNAAGAEVDSYEFSSLPGDWNYIEFKSSIGDSVSWEVRLNMSSVLSGSGADLKSSANAYFNKVSFYLDHGGATAVGDTAWVDDFYIVNGTDYLGDVRVDYSVPVLDVVKQFTPSSGILNYDMVNETVIDGDSTYVQHEATPGQDVYECADLTLPGKIFAVSANVCLKKQTGITSEIYALQRIDATDYVSADISPATANEYKIKQSIWETNPLTGIAWVLADLKGRLVGVKTE